MFGIYRYCSALPPLFLTTWHDRPIEHTREELVKHSRGQDFCRPADSTGSIGKNFLRSTMQCFETFSSWSIVMPNLTKLGAKDRKSPQVKSFKRP
ncbi:hypothetical protein J6590_053144 [Homalodisca vitripennis]|nr:hypothetical protein J6590_053144 [Homalodisca vitripennis]